MSLSENLAPISANFTLKDHTYELLKSAILDMNIYDEATELRLDERDLASRLQISRTPIREALARLAQEGLVAILPRKGVFVIRKSLSDILEMIITWAALESMAARLAAVHATDDQLNELRAFAMQHSKDSARADIEEYSDLNIRFHRKILELSGCALLKTTADSLFQHMPAVRKRAMAEDDRASRSIVDHMQIIEALEARDSDLSCTLVRKHTMKLHDHIRNTWKDIDIDTSSNSDNSNSGMKRTETKQ